MILASNGRFYEQHKVLTQLFAQYIELSYCISFTALLHIWNMLFSMVNDMRPLTALLSLSIRWLDQNTCFLLFIARVGCQYQHT